MKASSVVATGQKIRTKQRFSINVYLGHAVVDDERFSRSSRSFRDERLVQNFLFDSQQLSNGRHDGRVLDRHRLVVVVSRFLRLELDVADVQDGRQDGKHSSLRLAAKSHKLHRLFESRQFVTFIRFIQIMVVALLGMPTDSLVVVELRQTDRTTLT